MFIISKYLLKYSFERNQNDMWYPNVDTVWDFYNRQEKISFRVRDRVKKVFILT